MTALLEATAFGNAGSRNTYACLQTPRGVEACTAVARRIDRYDRTSFTRVHDPGRKMAIFVIGSNQLHSDSYDHEYAQVYVCLRL